MSCRSAATRPVVLGSPASSPTHGPRRLAPTRAYSLPTDTDRQRTINDLFPAYPAHTR
ncbi:MAG: hypothetical protein ACRDTA_27345 [Pseudonocardiaceae bacterium]